MRKLPASHLAALLAAPAALLFGCAQTPPAADSAVAQARPIPWLAPVTIAT